MKKRISILLLLCLIVSLCACSPGGKEDPKPVPEKTFTVSFDSKGGSACEPMVVKDGAQLSGLPVPVKEGFEFVCWQDKNEVPIGDGALLTCEDITLNAVWKEKTFTVTFDSKGGSACEPMVFKDGAQLSGLPVPVKEGFEFVCWQDKNEVPIGDGALLTCEDITLTAKWKKIVKTFTVSFDSRGGSKCKAITVKENHVLPALPVPTKDGYQFVCWEDQHATPILEGALLCCADVTLYAKWEEAVKSFTVTFDSKGGSPCKSIVVKDGDVLPALPVPTKDGAQFVCWEDRHATPILEGALLYCEDVTLYAHWE